MDKNAQAKKTVFNRRARIGRTAAKQRFRLEEDILLSATDRHSDSYRIIVTAHAIRGRYNVHLKLHHEPSQSIVLSQTWILTSKERCEELFKDVVSTVTDVRDFIEEEGLRTTVAQYILRYRLHDKVGDIEDMYDKAVPYLKYTPDHSSRGNLFINFPFIPGLVQNGEDKLEDVFSDTGNAPNPIPESPPYALSEFQKRALESGAVEYRMASSDGDTDSPVYNAIKKISKDEGDRAERNKDRVLSRYESLTRSPREAAEALFDGIKSVFGDIHFSVAMNKSDLILLLSGNHYFPAEQGILFNKKKGNVEKVLGIPSSPFIATVGTSESASEDEFVVCFSVDPAKVVLRDRSADKVRNALVSSETMRYDESFYSMNKMEDCLACALLSQLGDSELLRSPESIINTASSSSIDFVDAIIYDVLRPGQVCEVISTNSDAANSIRRLLTNLGRGVPVSVVEKDVSTDEYCLEDINLEPTYIETEEPEQLYLQVSDRVVNKDRLNNPSLKGTIVDTSEGKIVVDWDDESKATYDLLDAVSQLIPIEDNADDGLFTYDLPNMDDESVAVLLTNGLNPINIQSLASSLCPVSDSTNGWKSNIKESFAKIGVDVEETRGFLHNPEGDVAFEQYTWFEGALPNGDRFILDISPRQVKVLAGTISDYVSTSHVLVME